MTFSTSRSPKAEAVLQDRIGTVCLFFFFPGLLTNCSKRHLSRPCRPPYNNSAVAKDETGPTNDGSFFSFFSFLFFFFKLNLPKFVGRER